MSRNQAITNLLSETRKLSVSYAKKVKETGENFNIFNVLGLSTKEVRTHSAFIAELLNPKGSHELGDRFLKLFNSIIVEKKKRIEFVSMNANAKVEKYISHINKEKTEGGNIDIVCETFTGNKAIIIENKIYAQDQESQLVRYHNYAAKKYKNPNYILLYLTLFGKEPSKISIINQNITLKKGYDYYTISYQKDILEWLKECRKAADNHNLLKETIVQYMNLIKQLTNQTMNDNMKQEMIELVTKNDESLKSFFNLSSIRDDVKYDIFKGKMISAIKSVGFEDANEEINNDNKRAYLDLRDGYKLGVWLASYIDDFIIGVICPDIETNINNEYCENIKNMFNEFGGEIQEWEDCGIIAFRPKDYTRLNFDSPWVKIYNGEFEKFLKSIVENIKRI